MTTVTIYHNVQHECRECGQPVISLGDDEWAHLREGAGHAVVRATAVGHNGYQPGQALVPVFQAEVPDSLRPEDAAQRMYNTSRNLTIFGTEDGDLAAAYLARKLRPLSIGDVVDVGGMMLAVAYGGFTPVTGEIRRTWVPYPGTVPLPHCWFCHAIAGETELEPFNRAGTLACRNGEACADQMNGPRG
jgi:hypothetical protein